MIIEPHLSFTKSYRARIAPYPKLVARVTARIALFEESPAQPLLRDHALTGRKLRLRAFSVGGDLRIVYLPKGRDHVLLLDIGTHNQVY